MKVLLVSKALVVPAYQRKAEVLAAQGDVDLVVVVPPAWRDSRGEQAARPVYTRGYRLHVTPVFAKGRFHIHFYPQLRDLLDAEQPDLLHVEEEPYNLATWLALTQAQRRNIPACFFTWQNLLRRYPPPFRWFERSCYRMASHAIAGSHTAAHTLRAKGYRGPLTVIPQFGVDPTHFSPASSGQRARRLTIGYAGGLLPEKGVDLLLHAVAGLPGDFQVYLAGKGMMEAKLRALADELGLRERVVFIGSIESETMPDFYRDIDTLVLPSLTRRNWMEQFGRVLIEAMSCGVPVIGSDSGEIPHVIGDAGLIFPEGDVAALRHALAQLMADDQLRADLAARGRQRVLDNFTHEHVAAATASVYRQMLNSRSLTARSVGEAPRRRSLRGLIKSAPREVEG